MGPRLQERGVGASGESGERRERSFNGAALTRARSYPFGRVNTFPAPQLQWGRAYKSAELGSGERRAESGERLQWGRAYKSAELF